MKFSKPFSGVVNGDVMPTDFGAGDDCPRELEAGARELGALRDKQTAAEAKAADAEADAEGKAAEDAAAAAAAADAAKS